MSREAVNMMSYNNEWTSRAWRDQYFEAGFPVTSVHQPYTGTTSVLAGLGAGGKRGREARDLDMLREVDRLRYRPAIEKQWRLINHQGSSSTSSRGAGLNALPHLGGTRSDWVSCAIDGLWETFRKWWAA